MSVEVWELIATCPPGPNVGNPLWVDIHVQPGEVAFIRVRIPPGPRGNLGFVLGMARTPIYPREGGNYIIADNETIEYVPPRHLTSGAWQVGMVNGGTYSHSVYVTIGVNVGRDPSPAVRGAAADLTGSEV